MLSRKSCLKSQQTCSWQDRGSASRGHDKNKVLSKKTTTGNYSYNEITQAGQGETEKRSDSFSKNSNENK